MAPLLASRDGQGIPAGEAVCRVSRMDLDSPGIISSGACSMKRNGSCRSALLLLQPSEALCGAPRSSSPGARVVCP
ncbi:hypothetical protein HPB50_013115 [Hyalomma asiaticum]|uniref:Uncharacterized protein n=1 Tax=Hyalomma asiaticum TaxID=266040 RepID=A0ACB7S665_HYAAI|nr:hypothetical protein HPB50_013115 [Hyalomma asiaticum]